MVLIQIDGILTKAATIAAPVAGAASGAVVAEPFFQVFYGPEIYVRIFMAAGGAVCGALVFRPDRAGSRALFARLWIGAFIGFVVSPAISNLPLMGWSAGDDFNSIAYRATFAGLMSGVTLETAAKIIGSSRFSTRLRDIILDAIATLLGGSK